MVKKTGEFREEVNPRLSVAEMFILGGACVIMIAFVLTLIF